jgi:hypothetical protein
MTDHDDLHDAFGALLGQTALPPVDRAEQVHARIGRIRRRRQAAGAVGAAVVIAGAGLVFANVRNHAPSHESVAALRAAPAPKFSLSVLGGPHGKVNKPITLQLTMTGLAENPDDYGLKFNFGTGSPFRLYGTSHCVLTTPVNANIVRTVGWTYNQPGTYRITATATLCGVVKGQATTTVVVTR